jgi:hypothetical protein
MTDGQTLYLILCVLYLPDCLIWLGTRSVLFSSPWCGRWRSSFGSRCVGNKNGGLALLNPLPPLGLAFRAYWSPISLSPTGVCDLNLQSIGNVGESCLATQIFQYEDISEIGTDGKRIILNDMRFAKCATCEQAETLAQFIARLVHAPLENRGQMIHESFDALFNKEEAQKKLREILNAVANIRRLSSSLFVFLYLLVPVVTVLWGLHRTIIPAAMVMLATAIAISRGFLRAHQAIYPSRKGDRVGSVVKMICCSPVAIRAVDFVALDAMSCFHPILLADLLLETADNLFSRAFLGDLKHPLRHDSADPEALAIAQWYATAEFDACMKFLKMQKAESAEDLLRPPPWDGISSAYCPRCSCQFTLRSGECPDCPGVQLLPLSALSTAEVAHGQ